MKKIFTHLFAVLLLSLVTTSSWAQITFTVDPSKGSYSGTGTYCTGWTSNSEDYPETKISVSVNNMATSPASSSSFEIATGQTSPSTWYLMVDGCRILSYSFKCKLKDSTSSITVIAGDNSYVMTTEEQTVEVSGLDNVQKASFQLSGDNKHLVVTELTFTASPILEEGCVYMFKNARADRSLRADGADDVHTKETDANDTAQQWYVTKEDGYYILRNVAYGKYLKGYSTSGTEWSMTDDYSATENKFELHISNSTLNTLKTKDSDSYGYMHDDTNQDNGGCNVVGWLNGDGNTGSHWTITKVDYTAEQITALLEKAPTVAEIAGYTTALGELFADVACVTPELESLAEAQASNAYKALPTGLKAMVDKVYNEKTEGVETAWYEDNANAVKEGWSGKYAKKFRVQMYEPYSIAGDITSWLGINAHANNDNPTGIYVPEAGTLYVMVEGTINDGASLRIVDGGHNERVTNATGGGYALKPGLNVINYTATAGQLYICYNVDTYNPDGATTAEKFPHKLSDYAPLKIHIEGGAIAGYYNACGDFRASAPGAADDLWYQYSGASVDCDADWEYMETRANLNVIPLLAHRQILLFQLEDWNSDKGMKTLLPDLLDVPTTPYNNTKNWADYGMECDHLTGKINIMLEAWDRIMYSELATMGLVSQSTMAQMNAFYPRWESDYTTKYEMYDYTEKSLIDNKTYQEFCNGLDYSEYFNHHGIALGTESGYMYGGWDHCGYHINTFGGIVQNMANNAGSTWGPAHEIGHQHQALLTLNGLTEVTNNLFSNIALWYKGMSTSRYNGKDGSLENVLAAFNTEGSDTYTNNIWALTHLYYRLWLYYHLAGNNTQFYPRLFELLRQQPMQKGYNVSGDVSTLHFYKLACQAAGEDLTEFFRAHGYFSIMDDRLVGDYSNSVYEVSQEMIDEAIAEVKEMGYEENLAIIFICDDDENAKYVQHDGVTKRDIYGETTSNSDFGSVSDFINGNESVKTAYTATLNSDGTLTMSGGEGGVGFLVLNEDGEIVSFSNKSIFALSDEAAYLLATGKASVVTVDTESTTTEAKVDVTAMRFALLQELIEKATALTQNTSKDRVGFYKPSAVTNLQNYITMAQGVIDNDDLANLQAVYELLYAEYNAVVANEFSRVTFVPGSKYAIINKGEARIMSAADGYVITVAAGSDYVSTTANQWYLERDVAFRLKNADTNTYAQEVTDQNGIRFTMAADVVDYNITETSLGWYSLACSKVPSRYMNMNGANTAQVITWGSMGDANSQWKFILLEADDTNKAKEELLELSKKTLALVNEVATVSYNEGSKIELQSTNSGNANYIWSNAAVSGNDVDKLLDSDKGTYFHSQWNNSTAPTDGWGHHISVDLGTSSTLTSFKFKFTTRNESNLSNYPKTIEVYGSNDNSTYTKLQVASGFATGAGVDNEAVVMGNGTAYRYLRFLVTDATNSNAGTNTGSDGKVFFHMSEFSIYPVTVSATVKSDYTSVVTVDAVLAAYNDAEQGKTVYNNASATIDDINAKKTALQSDDETSGSYVTLLNQYNAVVNSVLTAKKGTLKEWIDKMTDLMEDAGTSNVITEDELLDAYYANSKANKLYTDAESVAIVEQAITDLQAAYNKLYAAMNNTAALKANLKKLIDDTQALYDKMATDKGAVNEYYSTSSLTADNLSEALAMITAAQTVYDNSSATVNEINAAYYNLNEKYTILKGIEDLDVTDRGDLNNLIATMQSLLGQTTVNGAVEVGNVALQVTDKTAPFYIWNYKPATDDNGIAALIDETDGTANTGTFTGTYWQDGAVEPYTHYLEIDMGVNNVLEDLSIDYTTRNSTHENQRPDALKFLGSNNKVDYEEFYSVTTGLPADANTKWTMPVPIELAKNYRYVRIAVSTDVGYFNMSDFNLYSNSIATVNEFYSTSDIFGCLPAVLRGYSDAKKAVAVYLLSDDYKTAKELLQAQIDALQAIIGGNVDNRTSLEGLITQTNTLIEEVATVSEEEAAIAMQCTDVNAPYYLYCNAPGKTNTTWNTTDSTGVKSLLDDNADTYLHTTYEGNDYADDLDHYLRLDMGENEALAAFKFNYVGRVGETGNAPKTIVIEGSNDRENFEEITTLSALPTANNATYQSDVITNGKAYRYIRFMVKETSNGSKYKEHQYFALSQFAVTACKTIEVKTEYVSPNLPLSTLVTANNEVVDATVIKNQFYVTETVYDTTKEELQAAYNALNLAKNLKELPVILTTDVNNPVLYKIKVKSNENVFTYDGQKDSGTKNPVLAADELGNRYQAWYFMQGENADSFDDVLIMPYYNNGAKNTTLKLGYANITGATKPVASESGASSYNWYITFTSSGDHVTTEGWRNLQPENGTSDNTFVNQEGGSSSTILSFWKSVNNPDDPGSQFRFVLDETDYSLSDAYYALYNKHAGFAGTLTGGEVIGDYTVASVTEFNNAYTVAGEYIEAKDKSDDEYTTALQTLENSFAAIEYIMPEEGKLYMIRSISTETYCSGKYVHALCDTRSGNSSQDHRHLVYDALGDISQFPLAVFTFEDVNANGECKMKNLHTGMYVKTFIKDAYHMTTDYASAATVKIGNFAPGQAILRVGDERPMHAQEANAVIVDWGADTGNASLWSIDEVTDLSQVVHNVTMTAKFSSVTLGYDATAPAGVKVYNAIGIVGGYVSLVMIADGDKANNATNVIPANTPVILYRTDDVTTKTFNYTNATATKPSESVLGGSLYTKYVECDDDKNYYKLMLKDGEAKMYWMYKEFDASGQSQGKNDNGGHIKCSANKIYMALPGSGVNPVAMYGMRFVDDSATGLEEMKGESGEVKTIYDLQGRKLTEITEPGMYIVDGKKVYVK